MAHLDVSIGKITKGSTQGGARGYAGYISRDFSPDAVRYTGYLDRSTGQAKNDLVRAGEAHLPSWADNAKHFFQMADRYERRNGVVARLVTVSLPRELSLEGRLALADDIREAFCARQPHSWALHCPSASDGRENPHIHIIMSERQIDACDRTPKLFFSRAATPSQDEATHGARKEARWHDPDALTSMRRGVAVLVNASLEREGIAQAVTHLSLRAQGHAREASNLPGRHPDLEQVQATRAELRERYHPWETLFKTEAWAKQRDAAGLDITDRQAVIDFVKWDFWHQDRSQYRELERERVLERALTREAPTHDHKLASTRDGYTRSAASYHTSTQHTPAHDSAQPARHEGRSTVVPDAPWMFQQGGYDHLSATLRIQAQTNYDKWQHKDKYSIEDYVQYVQDKFLENGIEPHVWARQERTARQALVHASPATAGLTREQTQERERTLALDAMFDEDTPHGGLRLRRARTQGLGHSR